MIKQTRPSLRNTGLTNTEGNHMVAWASKHPYERRSVCLDSWKCWHGCKSRPWGSVSNQLCSRCHSNEWVAKLGVTESESAEIWLFALGLVEAKKLRLLVWEMMRETCSQSSFSLANSSKAPTFIAWIHFWMVSSRISQGIFWTSSMLNFSTPSPYKLSSSTAFLQFTYTWQHSSWWFAAIIR